MATVKIYDQADFDRGLAKFTNLCAREGILRDYRTCQAYVPKNEKRRSAAKKRIIQEKKYRLRND